MDNKRLIDGQWLKLPSSQWCFVEVAKYDLADRDSDVRGSGWNMSQLTCSVETGWSTEAVHQEIKVTSWLSCWLSESQQLIHNTKRKRSLTFTTLVVPVKQKIMLKFKDHLWAIKLRCQVCETMSFQYFLCQLFFCSHYFILHLFYQDLNIPVILCRLKLTWNLLQPWGKIWAT